MNARQIEVHSYLRHCTLKRSFFIVYPGNICCLEKMLNEL